MLYRANRVPIVAPTAVRAMRRRIERVKLRLTRKRVQLRNAIAREMARRRIAIAHHHDEDAITSISSTTADSAAFGLGTMMPRLGGLRPTAY
jgi:hypothetical protein